MEGCGQPVEDKSYLYKMRTVKSTNTCLPSGTKARWKVYLNNLEKEIVQRCKDGMTDLAMVLPDDNDYNVVARILNVKETVAVRRPSLDTSTGDTLIDDGSERLGRQGTLVPRAKSADVDDLRDSSLMVSDSLEDIQMRSSFIDYSQDTFRMSRMGQETESEMDGLAYTGWEDHDRAEYDTDDNDDVYVNPPTPPPEQDMEPWIDKRSPYQKFFSLAEYKATRWRRGFSDSKPRELLTAQEKEEQLYNMIASDFCKWVADCQFKSVQLDEATITELFQVGMETPAVKAMCVQTKELPVVPSQVAEIFNMPEKSEMAGLKRQVKWDKKVAWLRSKGIVNKPRWKFANHRDWPTPHGKASLKLKTNLDKWFSTNLLKQEEKTGEILWGELEKTKVFKHFCNWIIENDRYKRPKFLEKKGYFSSKFQIDETDMVRVDQEGSSVKRGQLEDSVRSRREFVLRLAEDKRKAEVIEELVSEIPGLKAFLEKPPPSRPQHTT